MDAVEGRRVLVTGASSGIGEVTARAFASAGARVALIARRSGPLDALAEELGAVACPADLTDEAQARAAVDEAADRMGGIDAVVNNAGLMRPSLVSEGRVADWRAMLEVNVMALLLTTHAALPHLREAGRGDIVNVSSMSGRRVSAPTGGVYSGTKFAVHAITEGLRQELGEEGIRVTVIAPGLVATDLLADSDNEAAARLRQRAGEFGLSPRDVADQIVHIVSQPAHVLLREIAMSPAAQSW